MPPPFNLDITPQSIAQLLTPYVVQHYVDADDPDWAYLRDRTLMKQARALRRHKSESDAIAALPRVADVYEDTWSSAGVEKRLLESPAVAMEWGSRKFKMRSIARKRVHQLLLLRALQAIDPRTAIEVGCGDGLNLALLAGHCPDVRLAGVELTAAGARAAHGLLSQPALPQAVRDFAVAPLRDAAAHTRVRVVRASAAALPFGAAAYDVVFTVLALEQMEAIREAALRELRRVARRYVVMIEPFRDWNEEGPRRTFIRTRAYFQARIADLPAVGLRPVAVVDDLPNKIKFHVGMVIAEVV